MTFKVVIQNLSGSQKWRVPFSSFSVTDELNIGASGNVKFADSVLREIGDYYGQDSDFILQGAYREVYIYDEAGFCVFGGYVGEPTSSIDANGGLTRTIAINSWLELLEARFTNLPEEGFRKVFTNTQAKDIIVALVNYTQGRPYGNLGFTFGTMQTDVARQRTFKHDTLKEAFVKMSGKNVINGIDVEITPEKVINTFYPAKGSLRANMPLIIGKNIRNYSTTTRFINKMANEILVFGEGQDEQMFIELVTSSDEVKENYFLLQRSISEKDTAESANLIAKGEAALNRLQSPKKMPVITVDYENPLFSQYDLGDSLPVIIPRENINDNYRLKKRTLNHLGKVTLSFDEGS